MVGNSEVLWNHIVMSLVRIMGNYVVLANVVAAVVAARVTGFVAGVVVVSALIVKDCLSSSLSTLKWCSRGKKLAVAVAVVGVVNRLWSSFFDSRRGVIIGLRLLWCKLKLVWR